MTDAIPDLKGKTALVTGASRGIGRAAAIAYAKAGAHILAIARTAGALEELDDRIKAAGGSAFYSPPGERQARDGTLVGDARMLLLSRMPDMDTRRAFLDEVRIVALTDPIPNDVCAMRDGFSPILWERFEASLQRYLQTEEGLESFFDLVAGVEAAPTTDAAFDGFRNALDTAGMSADKLLKAAEEKLEKRRQRDSEKKE